MSQNNYSSIDPSYFLSKIREPIEQKAGLYSTRNSSKGALLQEAKILFDYLANENSNLNSARKAIIEDNILNKNTYYSRRTCWKVLRARYFPRSTNSVPLHPIVSLFKSESNNALKEGVLYYHFITSDLFYYEATTELIFTMAQHGIKTISHLDLNKFLNSKDQMHPEINQWTPQTRKSLISHYLSALRDFGILEGKVKKRIQKPKIGEDLFLYVVTCLNFLKRSNKEIINSYDFRLFLLTPQEVEFRLHEANRTGRLRYQKSAHVISLEIPWRSIIEYIEETR